MMFTACDDDDDNGGFVDDAQAVITKIEASTVEANPGSEATEDSPAVPATPASFTLSAEYKMVGNAVCSGAGFCYSTEPNPTIYDNGVKADVLTANSFSSEVEELLGTTQQYFIRAYVMVYKGKIVYSEPLVLNPIYTDGGETPAE